MSVFAGRSCPIMVDEANDGLSLAGVREGGPAAKAGLKQGDLIVKIGDKAIATIYDYMDTMTRISRATRSRWWSRATART